MHSISTDNSNKMPFAELLAPAGSVAALHAAVCAGADAVYLGLDQFNARRGADNFTMPVFREACAYAHLRGVRIYVTLNTAILPRETKEVLEYARQAWRAGADAFIVQDIGLAAELRRTLPEVRLHISTQMNTHNVAGIAAAAQLEADRITLARELSIDDVERLAKAARQADMEIEVFAHGAICVCYSGQCFMSSMIGGRSANRGMCAQACRLPYELRSESQRKPLDAPGEHLLSPKDLCTIDLLGRLIAAGVKSFKIEGRMKSADYVYAVVSVYRAVLDRLYQAAQEAGIADPADYAQLPAQATEDERRILAEAFSRGFTTAYLEHNRTNAMMSYQRPNNRGVAIGRVSKVGDDWLKIDHREPLCAGDVVEVWTKSGRATFVLGVDDVVDDMLPLNRANRDQRAIRTGDRVFRVRNAQAAFEDDGNSPAIPIAGKIDIHLGDPIRATFWPVVAKTETQRTCMGTAEGIIAEPARTKAITESEIRDHIDRLGQTPYVLMDLEIQCDEGVGMGFSALHHVRADALDALSVALLEPYANRALQRVEAVDVPPSVPASVCTVAVWATNPACARAAKRAGADAIYVPALNYKRGYAQTAGQVTNDVESAGYPKGAVIALPVVDFDMAEATREQSRQFDAWEYVEPGNPVLAENWGGIVRALNEGALVEVGPHVPVVNALTLNYLASLGVERVWLSPELTLDQIKELGGQGTPVALGLCVSGTQELMVCEHCILMSAGDCAEHCDTCPRRRTPHYLHDRKGFDFPVVTDAMGRSHIYNSVLFDVVHVIPELLEAGITSVMVDATLMNPEQTAQAVGRVVRARDIAQKDGNVVAKINAATTGHLFRGVQ